MEAAAAKAATYIVVQLMIGGAGAETVIGQYLVPLSTGSTVALGYRQIYPFIPVANGVRISAKTADSVGSAATLVTLECIAQTNVVDDAIAVTTVTSVTNQLTAAQIATGVWQDAVAGDFTTASSIGKSLYIANVAPGAAGGLFIAGTNAATTVNFTGSLSGSVGSVTGAVGSVTGAVGSVTGAVGSVTGNVGGNVVGSVASVTARVTANTDQLAGQIVAAAAGVTFPTSVASPTNITAGTITTVTNLTNAPTAGDLTATMKASVTTAATAATPTAAAVTGAVGSVTGAVGSVTAGVTLAASQHVIVDSGTVTTLTNLPAVPANWITAAGITAGALNGKGDWNIGKTGYSLTQAFPTNFASMSLTVGGLVTLAGVTHTGAVIPTVSAVTGLVASNLDATISSRSTYAGGAVASVTGSVGSVVGLTASNLDAAVSTRLASAGYTAPDNVSISAIKGKTDNLPAAPASTGDVAVVAAVIGTPAGVSVSADVAAVKSDTAGVKAKTDQLEFTVAGKVDSNLKAINDVSLIGTGAVGNLFGV